MCLSDSKWSKRKICWMVLAFWQAVSWMFVFFFKQKRASDDKYGLVVSEMFIRGGRPPGGVEALARREKTTHRPLR